MNDPKAYYLYIISSLLIHRSMIYFINSYCKLLKSVTKGL